MLRASGRIRTAFLRKTRNAVQHTRGAESIRRRANRSMADGLLFFSCEHKNESRNIVTHSIAGAQRDLDSVHDWGEAHAGRRNQVVRGCRAGRRLAEARRLLAYGSWR